MQAKVTDIETLAGTLDDATRAASAVPQLTTGAPLTVDEAYAVQAAGIALRAGRGDTQVGLKLGFTSKAKAEQMGVHDVIVGVITSSMAIPDGGEAELGRYVHPRIEPEVAFRLGTAIDPSDPECDVHAATTDVAPALEIIDSRYRDFTFSLADVIADNTSAAAFVIGPWRPYRKSDDLRDRAVTLAFDGDAVGQGSTADILGDPTRALDDIVRMAREHGLTLPAGSIILAGAATAAAALTPATTVTARVAGLGEVSVRTAGVEMQAVAREPAPSTEESR
ncbi:2-keto-4-pentenoate hydratase [Actinomadura sp. 9N407]|uniref:2-keto-4-pentenoate hydratase n=1 Tax=Actinomadura sp. 9N407 TaxID=3375154 RepID=UPI0037AF1746